MWLYCNNSVSSVKSLEDGIEKLLKERKNNKNAYLECDGKRLFASDIIEGETLEDSKGKMREITAEEYIQDIEEAIENSGGEYSGFDVVDDILRIPNNSIRIPVMKHFIDMLYGIPYITDRIVMEATEEEKKDLYEFYKEKHISIEKYVFEPKIWIVPENDLESRAIIDMLKKYGERYLVTSQPWGASWEGLEPEIKSEIEMAKKTGKKIYGIELQGNPDGVINIDHHIYGEDDRSNSKSSIEQVAEILEVDLSVDEMFISANDKGFIPAMEKLGEELGIEEKKLQSIISYVRRRDRLAQGVSLKEEEEAEEAVEKLGEIKEKKKYILVEDLPHSKTSTITDRLYGKYENLLITSTNGETNFYGTTEVIEMLNEKFPGGWLGGQLEQGSGFWGGYAEQEAIKKAVEEMIMKQTINQNKQEDARDFDDDVK